MALLVQDSLLTTIYILMVVGFTVGAIVAIFITIRRAGPASRAAWASRRKKGPLAIHFGRDGFWRLFSVYRSIVAWNLGDIDVIPEPKSVFNFQDGLAPPMGVIASSTVATLDPEFLYDSDRIVENFGKGNPDYKIMSPDQVADRIDYIYERESYIRKTLEAIRRISMQEITKEDALNALADFQEIGDNDNKGRERIKNQLNDAIADNGKAYREELERFDAEKQVKFEQNGWFLNFENKKVGGKWGKKTTVRSLKNLITSIPVGFENFGPFTESAAAIDDIRTIFKENEKGAILEATSNRGELGKYITMAICGFIVILSLVIAATVIK